MKTYAVTVTQTVQVTLDESEFDEAFLREFRESFYPFCTINEHAEHLAQLFARGVYHSGHDFIEGYGNPKEIGIRVKVLDLDTDSIELSS